jgi:hypothetical protein
MRRIWAGPRPFALLRAGVRLSRGPLRCRAAHHSLRSGPSHPSRIPPTLQLLSATPFHAPAHLIALPAPTRRSVPRSCVPLHSVCYGSSRCIRPACATANPPHGPLPAGQPAAHRQPTAPLPGRARPPKGPHAARQHPPDAVAGHRLKMPTTCPQSLRSGHAGQHIRPASRRVSLGSAPSPRHHAPAAARSSSSGSAAEQSRFTLKRPAPPSNSWDQPQTPQKGI